MNLNGMLQTTLASVLKDCDIVKFNLISNEKGDIDKIIVEYVPYKDKQERLTNE